MVGSVLRTLRKSVALRGVAGTVALVVETALDRRVWSSLWRSPQPCEFDRNYGTDTGASVVQTEDLRGPNWTYSIRYSPTASAKLQEMLAALPIRHEDFIFIDFGSGKGRVLLLASELPFKAIIGLELSEQLHQVAQRNVAAYKSERQACKRIECVLTDATLCEVPPVPTVCYFNNPFREPVMTQVVRRLEASLDLAPRQMFILYYVPWCQHLFSSSKYFREFRVTREYAIYQSTVSTEPQSDQQTCARLAG